MMRKHAVSIDKARAILTDVEYILDHASLLQVELEDFLNYPNDQRDSLEPRVYTAMVGLISWTTSLRKDYEREES